MGTCVNRNSCPLLGSLPSQIQEKCSTMPSFCSTASILFKLRNSHINIVQGILLKSGHASKQAHVQQYQLYYRFLPTFKRSCLLS